MVYVVLSKKKLSFGNFDELLIGIPVEISKHLMGLSELLIGLLVWKNYVVISWNFGGVIRILHEVIITFNEAFDLLLIGIFFE